MQITGFVLEDSVRDWVMDGKTGQTRTIVLIDQDDGEARLLQPLRLKIPLESQVSGPAGVLRNSVVEAAITRIEQNERTKDVRIEGHIVRVAGAMVFREAAKKDKAAAPAVA